MFKQQDNNTDKRKISTSIASSLSFRLWSFSWPAFLKTTTSFCNISYSIPGTLSSVSAGGNSVGFSSEFPLHKLGVSVSLVPSQGWLNEWFCAAPFKSNLLLLSNDLVPPSNDFDVPLACFSTELVLEDKDLDWEVLLDKKPLDVNFEMLSAPPKDWRRGGPLLIHLPSGALRLLLEDPLKLSSSTLRRNWYFSWKMQEHSLLSGPGEKAKQSKQTKRPQLEKPDPHFQLCFRLCSTLSYSKLVTKLLHFPL